jgi:diacylglycerol kinase (ATP)
MALSRRMAFIAHETASAGEEQNIAATALDAGAKVIVCVGGDGTCTKVATVILQRRSTCALAVFPAGTGNDFSKTLGVHRSSLSDFASLLDRAPQKMDVGRTDRHYFLNSCGFGFDASVLEASMGVRWLRGNAVYVYSALRQLFTYGGVDVSATEEPPGSSRMLMVTVSNGEWLGGAFHIAPNASPTDGKLDVAFIKNVSVRERARLFIEATRGTHLGRRSVQQLHTSNLRLRFTTPPAMEIDGELRHAQSSTVVVECLPQVLSVIAAPGALST